MAEQEGTGIPVDHTRQVTIDALCEHFANDIMSVEEFERRVDLAHSAATTDELKELLRDLPGGDLPAVVSDATVPAPRPTVTAAAHSKEKGYVVAVMGGSTRKGRWTPARSNYAVAVCGGAQLDFREAVMPAGVTEVSVFAFWGGVEIIVPPGMQVESQGLAIMGGFEHTGYEVGGIDQNAPVLRVTGAAVMGGVEIKVRYPGETPRDARRRLKEERKERKRLSRGG